MDRQTLEMKLESLSPEKRSWFAVRLALRELPNLTYLSSDASYWHENARLYMFSVFRAVNTAILRSRDRDVPNVDTSVAARIAARAAARDANTSRTGDRRGFSAARTSDCAAAASSNSASAIAAIAAKLIRPEESTFASRNAIHGIASAIRDAVEADLGYLNNDSYLLWPSLWPTSADPSIVGSWNTRLDRLYIGLRQLDIEYWAYQLSFWLVGQFDMHSVERCARMPESIVDAGVEAMLRYLVESERAKPAEARVVYLGEGGAGKTSLIRVLNREQVADDEVPTPRVEIRTRHIDVGLNDSEPEGIRVHDWDFGGQVILHATHQFFLREQSVYVIVLDMRRCDTLDYWLDHARVFGKGAPVLIVLNKADQMPAGTKSQLPFNLVELQRRCPFVAGAWVASCKSGEGVDAFAATLSNCVRQTLILSPDYPESWARLMEAWEKKRVDEQIDVLPLSEFRKLCNYQGMDESDAAVALRALDKLGLALHYPGAQTGDEVVLNPEWITRAIYFVIWNSESIRDGRLTPAKLVDLFEEGMVHHGLAISLQQCVFLLKLMERFELAFAESASAGNDEYLVPMIAPVAGGSLPPSGALTFVFRLEFLPPALFYRYVNRVCTSFRGKISLWRTGASIQRQNTRGWILFEEHRREISLHTSGEHGADFLHELRAPLFSLLGETFETPQSDEGSIYGDDREGAYAAIRYTPLCFGPNQREINWFQLLDAMAQKQRKVPTQRGGAISIDALSQYWDLQLTARDARIDRQLQVLTQLVAEGRTQPINVTVVNTNSSEATSVANVANDIKIAFETVLQAAPPIDSGLLELRRALEDLRFESGESQNVPNLAKLEREIERLREDVRSLLEVKAVDPGAPAIQSSILGRIKKAWQKLVAGAKVFEDVDAIGVAGQRIQEILQKLADLIAQLP